MRLGRNVTDRLWTPYRSTYVSSVSVIEHPEEKDKEKPEGAKKVAFGFSRVLQEDEA